MTTPTLAAIHAAALTRLVATVALCKHGEHRGTSPSQCLFAEGRYVSTQAVLGNQ